MDRGGTWRKNSDCFHAVKNHNRDRAITRQRFRKKIRMRRIALIFISALLAGCAHFQPAPLAPDKAAAEFDARRLDNAGLNKFLTQQLGAPPQHWPMPQWDLNSLTLAAFYFHPSLEVARAQWQVAEAGIKTAGGRPNPTLTVTPEYNATTPMVSPWGPSVNFDVPIETMGKRSKRIAEAEKISESARFNFVSAAWSVRSGVRASLHEFVLAGRRAELLQKQFGVQQQIVKQMQQRFEAGALSRSELTPAQIALNKTQMDLGDAQSKQVEARSRLAEALGLSVAALAGEHFDANHLLNGVKELTSPEMRRVALRSRADVLAALADYAAAEADLRLEIAKQYPDLHLNPGYQYDQGDSKWSLGLTVELPILNQNQGAIAEAEARRKLSAAKFIQLQAQIIGDIDRAVAGWHAAQLQLKAGEALLGIEQQQQKSAAAQIKAGAGDALDLLNAQLELNNAQLAQLENKAKLQAAFGTLEDALQCPADVIARVIETIASKDLDGKSSHP